MVWGILNVFSFAVAFATMLVARFAAFRIFSLATVFSAFVAAGFIVLFDFTESGELALASFAASEDVDSVWLC